MENNELEWKENTDCNEYTVHNGKTITIFKLVNLYGYYIGEPTSSSDLHFGYNSKEQAYQYAIGELSLSMGD